MKIFQQSGLNCKQQNEIIAEICAAMTNGDKLGLLKSGFEIVTQFVNVYRTVRKMEEMSGKQATVMAS
uniref:Uncharacterized protein n=1 Tax=Romanomermis culicivorax TaxID=13658 RepID=A0A915JWF9_ROMCU